MRAKVILWLVCDVAVVDAVVVLHKMGTVCTVWGCRWAGYNNLRERVGFLHWETGFGCRRGLGRIGRGAGIGGRHHIVGLVGGIVEVAGGRRIRMLFARVLKRMKRMTFSRGPFFDKGI